MEKDENAIHRQKSVLPARLLFFSFPSKNNVVLKRLIVERVYGQPDRQSITMFTIFMRVGVKKRKKS